MLVAVALIAIAPARQRIPASMSFLVPNFITSAPKKRFMIAFATKRQVFIKEKEVLVTPKKLGTTSRNRLPGDEQKPRVIIMSKKQTPTTTHL